MTGRADKPKCSKCKHPISFHGSGTTACRALGCQCAKYVKEKAPAKDSRSKKV